VPGKEIRLKRLRKHSQRLLIVPMDHGVSSGPIPGLKDLRSSVQAVVKGGADAIILHKGLAKQVAGMINPAQCEMIVHLSASTSLSPDANRKGLVSSVDHAIRIGASAVSVHVNLGEKFEAEMIKDLGKVAEKCDYWEIPLLAMMYVRDGKQESEYDPEKVSHAARIAEELGADIVKVNYTGTPEGFAQVCSSVEIPVLIAGGPKKGSADDFLTMVADAIKAGAAGVSIGRNIFQNPNPEQLVRDIRAILDK
jgi:predicted phospho-2-dehydro-3-deoxyheptonate aldolase